MNGKTMNFQPVLDEIVATLRPQIDRGCPGGTVASYIPALARIDARQFGIALRTCDGIEAGAGDFETPFSIQSVSKLFTLTLAMQRMGDALWERIGREPSGNPFNSLVQLENEQGKPRNPFINAGALVVADVLVSHLRDPERVVLDFMRARGGNPQIGRDSAVDDRTRRDSHRNRALAHFIRSFGNLVNDVDRVLALYSFHCALRMDCVDLARSVLFLADRGRCPSSDDPVTSAEFATRINAVMLTCGTYDAAGEFAFYVGLPAKSGVGGGIVAVVPGLMSLCVWSPALDDKGNSLLGAYALHRFTRMTGLSVF